MKRLILFVLVFGLVFASVSPALAAGKGPRGTFALAGTITAIGDGSVTVQVLGGSKLVKPFINQALTVTVTASTRYLLKEGTTTTLISFADLKVGDSVSVNGTVANNVWTAKRITVGAQLIHYP
ncbi:MAG: hypothetical protein HY864_10395 [Chloroflexi bacterium]|nr:hypothetical protein [Chloroflexota bacterium]